MRFDEIALPPTSLNEELVVHRLPQHRVSHYEIKDPSIVQVADKHFMMFASVGNSVTQQWLVGRFEAASPEGPWQELEPVRFIGIEGPQLCAPAVVLEDENGKMVWKMYIQTACFEADGVIAYATSEDGHTFFGIPQPVATKDSIVNAPAEVIGIYDVGISEVRQGQDVLECMLYSGYRRIGCGDLYMSYRSKSNPEWSKAECILPQENVPFHNNPTYEHYEWGLEGAKIIQLADDVFMLIGVCFMPKPDMFAGTRQRVFYSVAKSIHGPFIPLGTPFNPVDYQGKSGENGHPDTIILNNQLYVIYQERHGEGEPWHLRIASYALDELTEYFRNALANPESETPSLRPSAHSFVSLGN